jgi:hypothetical protein
MRGAKGEVELVRKSNILFDAVFRAQSRLLPIARSHVNDVMKVFPRLQERDLLHGPEYDPEVPLHRPRRNVRQVRDTTKESA